jgi:tRNA dimethylallyltransferase
MTPVLCITGPTACGKTAAALALAQAFANHAAIEIISVDSALIYRGMDIGTAKPTPQELAQVPHHLIDILEPTQSYSAAEFLRAAKAWVTDIRARNKTPVLVGGTMLYLKALLDGLDDLPPANPAIRAEIDGEAQQKGWAALHAELAVFDAATAARLKPLDSQRIQRAIEVFRISGKPLSAHFGQQLESGLPLHIISIEPADMSGRAWLHRRIEQRLEAMFAQGFLDEVRTLKNRGDLHADLPAMRCVGYRQVWEGLDAGASAAQMLEKTVFATRQLAKRQITWLRSMAAKRQIAQALDCTQADLAQRVYDFSRSKLP